MNIIYVGHGTGHLFVAKDGKGWQRLIELNNPPNITLCDCCMNAHATPEVFRRFKELGIPYKNDGTNPPTEEEWQEAKRYYLAQHGSEVVP